MEVTVLRGSQGVTRDLGLWLARFAGTKHLVSGRWPSGLVGIVNLGLPAVGPRLLFRRPVGPCSRARPVTSSPLDRSGTASRILMPGGLLVRRPGQNTGFQEGGQTATIAHPRVPWRGGCIQHPQEAGELPGSNRSSACGATTTLRVTLWRTGPLLF